VHRRRFLLASLATAIGAPLAAGAQPAGKIYTIGFLGGGTAIGYAKHVEGLRLGLRDHGYVEGKNIVMDFRWADGKYEQLPALVGELVRRNVDVIVTQGTPAAFAAKAATTTIPVVMTIVGNPDDTGLVASLSHPGANVTGSSFFMAELNAKRLEILKTALPRLTRVAVLTNPGNPAMRSVLRAMEETATALKIKLSPLELRGVDDFDSALATAKTQVGAVSVIEDGLFVANAPRLAELSLKHQLAGIGFTEYAENGGLLAYGVDFPHVWRQSMALVDRIFKGAKPGDLPVMQATRFEVIVNLKAARTLGLTIPAALLTRADRAIE
jgi:putative ABC transport system substrate-binding protein